MTGRLRLSASMFTAIPVRAKAELAPSDAAAALVFLPVLGAIIGAAAGLPAAAIRVRAPHADLLGAVLAVAALAALTRALHLDGLADTADGLGSRAPAARARQIMKQSDIGPFGVVALVLVLAADIAALAGLRGGAWAPVGILAVSAATGRVAAVQAASRARAVTGSAFGALVAGRVSVAAAAAWTVAVLAFGAAVAAALAIPPGWILGPQAAALLAAQALRAHTARRLGGISGDVFGALIETATAVTLIGAALR